MARGLAKFRKNHRIFRRSTKPDQLTVRENLRLHFFVPLPDKEMIKRFTRLCSSSVLYLSLLHDLEIYSRSNGANQSEFSTQTNFSYILKHAIATYKWKRLNPATWYSETYGAQLSHIQADLSAVLRLTRSSYKYEISKSTALIEN